MLHNNLKHPGPWGPPRPEQGVPSDRAAQQGFSEGCELPPARWGCGCLHILQILCLFPDSRGRGESARRGHINCRELPLLLQLSPPPIRQKATHNSKTAFYAQVRGAMWLTLSLPQEWDLHLRSGQQTKKVRICYQPRNGLVEVFFQRQNHLTGTNLSPLNSTKG